MNLAASPLASRGFAARIGGSAAIASRWPRTRDMRQYSASYAGYVVAPGRAFLRRLIGLTRS
ncbi:MAG: hypothetical protein OIF51_15055, partial [Cellvibrionaceae bacterium]|nr:hypothetical protein [Cellvibrionaceae bacterium]